MFRVRLQSLLEFTTSTAPAQYLQAVVSHDFQYMMTDNAAETAAGMVAALRLQFLNTSQVDMDWWDLVNNRCVLRATAIRRDIAELTIMSPVDLPSVLPWVTARDEGWNLLMQIVLWRPGKWVFGLKRWGCGWFEAASLM